MAKSMMAPCARHSGVGPAVGPKLLLKFHVPQMQAPCRLPAGSSKPWFCLAYLSMRSRASERQCTTDSRWFHPRHERSLHRPTTSHEKNTCDLSFLTLAAPQVESPSRGVRLKTGGSGLCCFIRVLLRILFLFRISATQKCREPKEPKESREPRPPKAGSRCQSEVVGGMWGDDSPAVRGVVQLLWRLHVLGVQRRSGSPAGLTRQPWFTELVSSEQQ